MCKQKSNKIIIIVVHRVTNTYSYLKRSQCFCTHNQQDVVRTQFVNEHSLAVSRCDLTKHILFEYFSKTVIYFLTLFPTIMIMQLTNIILLSIHTCIILYIYVLIRLMQQLYLTPNDIGLASPLSKKIKLYLRVVCLFGDCFFYHYLTQCQLDVFLQPSTR